MISTPYICIVSYYYIITTPQDAIIDRENRERIPVSNDRPNYQNTRLW